LLNALICFVKPEIAGELTYSGSGNGCVFAASVTFSYSLGSLWQTESKANKFIGTDNLTLQTGAITDD